MILDSSNINIYQSKRYYINYVPSSEVHWDSCRQMAQGLLLGCRCLLLGLPPCLDLYYASLVLFLIGSTGLDCRGLVISYALLYPGEAVLKLRCPHCFGSSHLRGRFVVSRTCSLLLNKVGITLCLASSSYLSFFRI